MSVLLALACLIGIAEGAWVLRNLRGLRQLEEMPRELPPGLREWPALSVVTAARDEGAAIERALRSRLAEDYPALEVVAVDDRSTDSTPRILARLAAEDLRLRAVRVEELPEGWLGKTHALDRGAREATGEWLLFSDADVSLAPGTLRRAVAFAEREAFDVVSVVPTMLPADRLTDAAIAFMMRTLSLIPAVGVEDPDSPAVLAAGAFTLVRRSAYQRTPGFEWLRMEAGDDVGLGLMMKLSGARCALVGGRGCVSVRLYGSVRDAYRGMEKNALVADAAGLAVTLAALAAFAFVEVAPLAALLAALAGPSLWLALLGAVSLGTLTYATLEVQRASGGDPDAAWLWPVGSALFVFGMARSFWLGWRRGGVVWRGTFYPMERMLAGSRVFSPRTWDEIRALREPQAEPGVAPSGELTAAPAAEEQAR